MYYTWLLLTLLTSFQMNYEDNFLILENFGSAAERDREANVFEALRTAGTSLQSNL